MCNYTQTLHTLCGCKTHDLPKPNLCRLAIKNCTPCFYIAPLDSLNSMPGLSYSMSSISAFSSASDQCSPVKEASSTSFKASPEFLAFVAAQEEEDQLKRQLTLCPFHLEDCNERDFARAGHEQHNLAAKAVAKRKKQQKEKKEQRVKFGWHEKEMKQKRGPEESPQREWKKNGNWNPSVVEEMISAGTGRLVEVDDKLYLLTDKKVDFLGWF
jgi:hypothetical protein